MRGWPALWGFGALAAVVLLVILQGSHETRVIRRTVAQALQDRARLTDEEFGRRFYEAAMARVATRLRGLLAEHLECDPHSTREPAWP